MKNIWEAFVRFWKRNGGTKHFLFHLFLWGFTPVFYLIAVLCGTLLKEHSWQWWLLYSTGLVIVWAPVFSTKVWRFYDRYGFTCYKPNVHYQHGPQRGRGRGAER